MTKIARIVDNQVVTLEDFQNLASLPRKNQDALIRTAIENGQSYAGGTVTKGTTTQVVVESPVFLLKNNALYSNNEGANITVDLLSNLPPTGNKRIVAILVQAQEFNDATRPRDFEVDGTVYPPVMDPQTSETLVNRFANVTFQVGDAAPSPSRPIVDAANTVLAWVTLSSTEIVLVEQNLAGRIPTLSEVGGRVKILETWREVAEPTLNGLKADVSKLVDASRGKADRNFLGYMLEQLARLNEQVGVTSTASYNKTNYFLTDDDSDTAHINYVAKVQEGVRFADDNANRAVLALETPGDTRFQVGSDGTLLPKYKEGVLFSVWAKDSEVAVSNAGSQTVNYVLKTVSRSRIRYGNSMLVCTNAQWWQTGRFDAVKGTFERGGETFRVEFVAQHPSGNPNHGILRLTKFWYDTYEEPYWEAQVVAASYTGNVASNTFVMPRSGWITGFNLGFSRVDTGGDVRLILCEAREDGSPNYAKAVADVTVTAANLKVFPERTKFPLPPTYLSGGKRYAWAIITAGNHWLAMAEGNKYAQGTFFTSTDGVWSQGNIAQDASFEPIVAEFEVPRLSINLSGFNLTGGITDIDLDLEQIVPEGTNIIFEVKVGTTWYPLEQVASGTHPLAGLPALVEVRMILVGTTEVMPGIKVGTSYRTVSRPRVDTTHISLARTAPSAVTEIQVVSLLEHYVEADHDCVVTILTGASYGTEVTAAAVKDKILPDGSIRRTHTFTTGIPVGTTSWKVKSAMTTSSALKIFHIAEQTDIGFP